MPAKRGKEQIQQLLEKAVEKYEKETGDVIKRNTNRNNYIGLANKLSEISNRLPDDYPEIFEPDRGGRYEITKAQIRDALSGSVVSLKLHFSKALEVYIGNMPSGEGGDTTEPIQDPPKKPDDEIKPVPVKAGFRNKNNILKAVCAILLIILLFFMFKWISVSRELSIVNHQFDSTRKRFDTIKEDMRIVPHWPTRVEIDKVAGIWIVYSGSPQARISDPTLHDMVAWDIAEIKYKEGYGYFTIKRYGPTLDHQGFIQFDRPNLLSIFTDVTHGDTIFPKHSLFKLETGKEIFNVMSASWSWDTAKNEIIGIREVFRKIGNGGTIQPIDKGRNKNEPDKYLWTKTDGKKEVFQPKNESLDNLSKFFQVLLNENSFILLDPDTTRFH